MIAGEFFWGDAPFETPEPLPYQSKIRTHGNGCSVLVGGVSYQNRDQVSRCGESARVYAVRSRKSSDLSCTIMKLCSYHLKQQGGARRIEELLCK